jgi:hypothetical protein
MMNIQTDYRHYETAVTAEVVDVGTTSGQSTGSDPTLYCGGLKTNIIYVLRVGADMQQRLMFLVNPTHFTTPSISRSHPISIQKVRRASPLIFDQVPLAYVGEATPGDPSGTVFIRKLGIQ